MARSAVEPRDTGAPANANTEFRPTERSRVLLPDMFEPLSHDHLRAFDVKTHIASNAGPGIE